jgi:tRNA (guanine-N7-)-methyltransferase
MSQTQSSHRPIKSFVLRQGRITEAQARAFDLHWARYGLEYAGHARDFSVSFGRSAPLVLEIGFGNGEQLVHAAKEDPGRDFIGIEVHRPGVGRLMNALAAQQLPNVRVYCHDAVEVLQHEVADESLDEVRIYFPDPWPKKRHQKRRLVQAAFVELLALKLRTNGVLHLATDWQDYADHMRAVLAAAMTFRPLQAEAQVPRPEGRAETHFERRGLRLGHAVSDLLYQRC